MMRDRAAEDREFIVSLFESYINSDGSWRFDDRGDGSGRGDSNSRGNGFGEGDVDSYSDSHGDGDGNGNGEGSDGSVGGFGHSEMNFR